MRSASEAPRRPAPRAVTAGLVLLLAVPMLAVPIAARAEPMTFHLSARDALASVDRYNTFLVSLGRNAHGVKLIPGGTIFAGQSCAAFGTVFRLGSIAVLRGPAVLGQRAPSRNGKIGAALTAVFTSAGVRTWNPPAADAETSLPFWAAVPSFVGGVQFASEAVTNGQGDAGLLGTDVGDGVVRFRADVGQPDAAGRYRFLLELYGRTSSNDGALVVSGERRCFTFVDLAPVDVAALGGLVDAQVSNPNLNAGLKTRVAAIATALARRDSATALDTLATFTSSLLSRLDSLDPAPANATAKARLLTEAAFRVRRGVVFSPATAECGNGTRETGEACDGADLGGFDCTTVGFASGTLTCGADCRFITSGCVAAPVCGNGILEVGEECDNGSANSNTLPDACRTPSCKRAFCGDGVIDSFEDCEGRNLDGETCVSIGYDGGKLTCDSQFCTFDDSNCTDDF
jgi:hypothetical protein